jgi:hypothetical protein
MQVAIAEQRLSTCPYDDLIDANDRHCGNFGLARPGYIPLAEDSDEHDFQLASVKGPYLANVDALPIAMPILPQYIPVIQKGSGRLFDERVPDFVAVQLGEIVSSKKLLVPADLRKRLGVPSNTAIILLSYGKDSLIENIWAQRRKVIEAIATLGFVAVTSINYSIWQEHPHAERIFNVKRSLIVYEEMLAAGINAIPHVYWYGQKSLDHWVEWLHDRPCVDWVAINLQTERRSSDWSPEVRDLKYLRENVGRNVKFLVTGPSTPTRLLQVKEALSDVVFTGSYPVIEAWGRRRVRFEDGQKIVAMTGEEPSLLFRENLRAYEALLAK